jgi:3-oxoacyl-[acyl-carrier protein] reductase
LRNVIVTGASRGLGLAITTALVVAGYRVLAVARSESEELRELAASSGASGQGEVQFHSFDLLDTQRLGQLIAKLREEAGSLYGLVNNAGIGTAGLLAMMREEEIERLIRLNTLSPVVLTRHVVRSMMSERVGRIVNIASIVGATGFQGLSVYAATKAALIGFTRSLAREVGPLGITVNALAPGFIATDMTRGMAPEELEKIVRRSALRRLAEASDVACAVEFLLSDKAKSITGTTLTVDAGSTA